MECLRPMELEEALLWSDIETERSDPIESHAPLRRDVCDLSCNEPFDMSASDEFVSVDRGLVLLDPNELSDCLCFVRVWLWLLFSKKSPRRTCSSSSLTVRDLAMVVCFPLPLTVSSSVKKKIRRNIVIDLLIIFSVSLTHSILLMSFNREWKWKMRKTSS